MSAATVPQPGAEDDWEPIDEAVRDHLGELLTAGTNLFSGSQLMDRLDPLSVFAPLLRTGLAAASSPDKVAGVLTRAAGEMLRATAAATVRAAGGTPAYAPERGKDRRFADPAWTGNAGYWWLREIYHDWEQSLLEIIRDTAESALGRVQNKRVERSDLVGGGRRPMAPRPPEPVEEELEDDEPRPVFKRPRR